MFTCTKPPTSFCQNRQPISFKIGAKFYLRRVLYRINFTRKNLIDQAPLQIQIVHYDQNRTIKFQFVIKRGNSNFRTGDNFRRYLFKISQTVTAINSAGHCIFRAICLLKAILLLIIYFWYMRIQKKLVSIFS